jgi:hypothetical protein
MSPFPNEDRIVPENQVRFIELRAEPLDDPLKIRIYAKKQPSKEFPTIELAILDSSNHVIVESTLISVFQEDFVLTMHIPQNAVNNQPFTLRGKIIFEDPIGISDDQKTTFRLTNES